MKTFSARTALTVVLAAAALLAGCAAGQAIGSSTPEPTTPGVAQPAGKMRAPDAVGTVVSVTASGDGVAVVFAPDAGYEYFADTTFALTDYSELGSEGADFTAADLKEGDRIWVWTGACRESRPVQCDVERAQLEP